MHKYIAVVLAILVVVGALLFAPGQNEEAKPLRERLSEPLSLSFPTFSLKMPNLRGSSDVGDRAWQVFAQYREFAQAGNLEGVKSLSHQVSPACSDPARIEECRGLMTSVYTLTESWRQEDFPHVAFDDKQVVMSTEAFEAEDTGILTQAHLLLTRDAEGAPKMLGIKFCFGGEEVEGDCVNTDPSTRDADQNGWWDVIEERFYK